MKDKSITDRLAFLAELFDIFECEQQENKNALDAKLGELSAGGYTPVPITNVGGEIIAIISEKQNGKDRTLKKVSVCSEVFGSMIIADPTDNKIYLQWMLNLLIY